MLTVFDCIAVWPALSNDAKPFFELVLGMLAERRSSRALAAPGMSDLAVEQLAARMGKIIDSGLAGWAVARRPARAREGAAGSVPPKAETSQVAPPKPSPPVDQGKIPSAVLDVIAGLSPRVSRRQAWTALGISKSELDRLLHKSQVIPFQKEGRRVLILRLDLAAYLARQTGFKG